MPTHPIGVPPSGLPLISEVQFTAAQPDEVRQGLLGFVRLTLGSSVRVDGVTLRRTLKGRLELSFPDRLDRRGRRHSVIAPTNQGARDAITQQVIQALVGQRLDRGEAP
jgi:hypothetical protein